MWPCGDLPQRLNVDPRGLVCAANQGLAILRLSRAVNLINDKLITQAKRALAEKEGTMTDWHVDYLAAYSHHYCLFFRVFMVKKSIMLFVMQSSKAQNVERDT